MVDEARVESDQSGRGEQRPAGKRELCGEGLARGRVRARVRVRVRFRVRVRVRVRDRVNCAARACWT